MKREPFILYLIRFISGLALLAVLAMLYWSSVLVEENLKVVQGELEQIKSNIETIKEEEGHKTSGSVQILEKENLQADNLLTLDSFYKNTLPKLLGPHFKPHGIRKEASIGKPDNLHPFSSWSEVSSWNILCTVALATQKFGVYETYAPEAALSMELRETPEGLPEYWLTLRKDLFWHPLNPNHLPPDVQLASEFLHPHQVTAQDFKFYFDAIMNPHVESSQAVAMRLYYNDVEEMRVIDDFTLAIRWKTVEIPDQDGKVVRRMKYLSKSLTGALRPLPRFVYQRFADGSKIIEEDSDPSTYRINPVWAQNYNRHWAQNIIVSCGPWLFDGMTDREIKFKRNPDYFEPEAVLVDAFEVKFRNSPDQIWEDFKTRSLDLFDVPPNLLQEYELFLRSAPYQDQKLEGLEIHRLDYVSRSYNYVGWNEARSMFSTRKVRQALTLAIDRERIIHQNLNGMGIQTTGTFFPYSPSYDPSIKPYPFDPDRARQLLQEEGWYDSDGDGIIDKEVDGKKTPFTFALTYFVKNPTTKSICEYIATALKEVGIKCNLHGVDMADLSTLFEDKDFDALYLGWALGTPPEDPKEIWDSIGAKQKGSSNAIGFANAEIDQIIKQLEYEFDPQKRIALYHRFDAILYEEAPYTFLYAPKVALIYRNYLQNVFIPADHQDLIPGANVGEPQSNIFWIKDLTK